ncbi:MAG: T9SS type A sorting domain-containing protein [Bacteroidetes bacterium]|nr:T9SS type A sorting domain-containing protein [Bacteroidota bacterium]MBU1115200.1 T9SS type A sorting domain-containing protein [Bacteroidota bacterium]MBU1797831.1 T9SS type A sorting domain-containing protein [Bacteroidota bacterium]
MKLKIIIISMLLTFISLTAQTIYEVESGTKGNKIILSVENASAIRIIDVLEVTETNNSEFIDIKNNEQRITDITKGFDKEIEVEFDVLSEAPINEMDTLRFVLSNTNGESWSKEIVIEYTPPKEYALFQNYPNPFNPSTTIKYSIPKNSKHAISDTKLIVFDILGREVETLVNKKQTPGNYEVVFSASHLSSGTYFYRLISGDFSKTMKFILLK